MLQCRGRRSIEVRRAREEPAGEEQGDAPQLDEMPQKKQRIFKGGGPYRAYVSNTDQGQQRDFGKLAKQYREEILTKDPTDPERVALELQGRLATAACRAGSKHPFGPSARQLESAQRRRHAAARWEQLQRVPDGQNKFLAMSQGFVKKPSLEEDATADVRQQATRVVRSARHGGGAEVGAQAAQGGLRHITIGLLGTQATSCSA